MFVSHLSERFLDLRKNRFEWILYWVHFVKYWFPIETYFLPHQHGENPIIQTIVILLLLKTKYKFIKLRKQSSKRFLTLDENFRKEKLTILYKHSVSLKQSYPTLQPFYWIYLTTFYIYILLIFLQSEHIKGLINNYRKIDIGKEKTKQILPNK